MKEKLFRLLAIGLAMCLLLAGCAAQPSNSPATQSAAPTASATASVAPSSAPVKGGTMVFGLSAEPKNLLPFVDNGWGQKQITQCIYRTLFDVSKDTSLVPGLCDKYSVSADGLTWNFHIIDATFQNGDKVTAEDVKFSIEYIRDTPTLGAFATATYKKYIKEVKVVDDKTVEVITSEPFAPLKEYFGCYYAAILSKSWTQSHDLNAAPMGCGPFEFVSWERGANIKVKRYDKYAGQVANLDGIEFDFYADENARVNALKTGVVDIIDYVPAQQFASIEAVKGLVVDRVEGPFMFMSFNNTVDVLKDPKFRLALAYGIKREDIIKTAFNNEGTSMYGTPFTKNMVGFQEKYQNYYKYDPNKCKEMLAAAGYTNVSFKLGCSSQYAFNQNTAVAIQGDLKQFGINVELESSDWTTFFTKWAAKEFETSVNGTAAAFNDPDYLTEYSVTDQGRNISKYNNPKYDELMAAARVQIDKTKRAELYAQAQEIFIQEVPFLGLMWRIQAYARTDRLKNFVNLANGVFVQSAQRFNEVWLEKK